VQAVNVSSQAVGQGKSPLWIPAPRHLVQASVRGAEAQINTRVQGFVHHKVGRKVNAAVAPQAVADGEDTRPSRSVVATVVATVIAVLLGPLLMLGT